MCDEGGCGIDVDDDRYVRVQDTETYKDHYLIVIETQACNCDDCQR